jgi:hypothetical protein
MHFALHILILAAIAAVLFLGRNRLAEFFGNWPGGGSGGTHA